MAQRRQRTLRFLTFADLQPKHHASEQTREDSSASEELATTEDMETTIAERDVVQRCLHQLPRALGTPLLLSIVAGFSSREVAGLLNLKEATVRQRLGRARKAFQRLYRYECGEHLSLGENPPASPRTMARPRGHLMHRSAALVPAAP